MSTGINVFRYSALAFGVFYGISHQMTLKASAKLAEANREQSHREDLIKQAKQEFAKKNQPQQQSPSGVISDPENPNFDLEKWINAQAEAAS